MRGREATSKALMEYVNHRYDCKLAIVEVVNVPHGKFVEQLPCWREVEWILLKHGTGREVWYGGPADLPGIPEQVFPTPWGDPGSWVGAGSHSHIGECTDTAGTTSGVNGDTFRSGNLDGREPVSI
jgi:hypothetical protein